MRFPHLLCAVCLLLSGCARDKRIREAIAVKTGEVVLKLGEVDLSSPLIIDGASDLTIRGDGTTRLKMKSSGEAALIIRNSKNVRLENLVIDGTRASSDPRSSLPPADQSMLRFNKNNGVIVQDSEGVTLSQLTIRNVVSYPILVHKSKKVTVDQVLVGDSGSLDEKGHNNATGGILFEEGCDGFAVRRSKLRNIRGNGIWTHSLYTSPRNQNGEFVDNDLRYIGRDALQAGHAVQIKIAGNNGGFIGFPPEIVDVEHGAVPVALDTAGNVETSVYSANSFEEVNGKCIDLDGFHHGLVERNRCINQRQAGAYPNGHFGIVLNNSNPDMKSEKIDIVSNTMEGFRFGGLFLIGESHLVRGNTFRRINLVKCNENPTIGCLYKAGEPDLLRSGIYLGVGAERPAPSKNIVVEGNTVEGYGMDKYCIVTAPTIAKNANTIGKNTCGLGATGSSR